MSDRLHSAPQNFNHQQQNPQRIVPQYSQYTESGGQHIQLPLPHAASDGSRSQAFYQQTDSAYAPTSNYSTSVSSRPIHPASAPPQPSFTRIAPNGDLRHNLDVRANSLQETPARHVVGSQGRRGILPSAAGMPPAISTASSGKNSPPLIKDDDGKYPCPHCSKPYLHAKHLKRHMLRHTGVRPYACGLCKDTFSRSDILKRHFSKCSVRRGNPSGENHLAFSRANKKKHREAQERARQDLITQQQTMLALTVGQPYPASYSTSSSTINSPVGLGNFDMPQATSQDSLANTVRHNEMRRANSYSNRGSTSSINYEHLPGQVTPESSITTSGAVTPGPYQHDRSVLNSPASSNFTMGNTSTRNSATFQNGTVPQVYHFPDAFNLNLGSHEDLPAQNFSSGHNMNHDSFKDGNSGDFDFGDLRFHDHRN